MAFGSPERRQNFREIAAVNLGRWKKEAAAAERKTARFQIGNADWGVMTRLLTMWTGERFAVMNLANAK